MSTQTKTYDIPGLEALRQLRDELRVQIHLARMEARSQWDKLDPKWKELEAKLDGLEHAPAEVARELLTTARALVKDLADGYQRIRKAL
jgi:hypothetical protein